MMDFPDRQYLEQLQDDLWRWPKPRAAVMVGAGFSLNAEPLPGTTARFKTWYELARAIFDRLHPPSSPDLEAEAARREGKLMGANFLRLASEYEAAFGKSRLESLILELNPDQHYVPGKLHHLLMELPWVDVFTTNYDTLLERSEVDGRAYQFVTKPVELTSAFPPRIIKLHGSFPSQTPFIISEEDYRTYPRNFAPFVNSVRQCLLENSLVLLGFSGEDPNFLEWTGWIRDELGESHAPIYLVGPLSISNAGRKLLSCRGVTPIDLSPVCSGIETPQGLHRASLEWFLSCLAARRAPRPERWPASIRKPVALTLGLPPLAGLHADPKDPGLHPPNAPTPELLTALLKRWTFERQNYPGWVVAPKHVRSVLWQSTKNWLNSALLWSKNAKPEQRIVLFREIVWRFEVAMVPLLIDMMEPFRKTLDEFLTKNPLASAFADSTIASAWLTIAFAMWRDARESYDEAVWEEWKSKVERVVPFDRTFADRFSYEIALWRMWNVDRAGTRTALLNWQPTTRSPFAMLWKAGLLAELDELGEARTLLGSALNETRRALRLQGQNIELLSLEGWCMFTIGALSSSTNSSLADAAWDDFSDRWHELKAWDCSPWTHKEYFEEVLSGSPPKLPLREEVPEFELGHSKTSFTLLDDALTPILPAFGYIRMFEQAGLPMRIARVNIAGDALRNACVWLESSHSFWSPVHLMRAGRREYLTESILSRVQVAKMESQLAKRIYKWGLKVLQGEIGLTMQPVSLGSGHEAVLEVFSEVLSRLSLRMDDRELDEAFAIVFRLHFHTGVRSHPRLNSAGATWFGRLFEAASDGVLLGWLPKLLRAPLFEDGGPIAGQNNWWPDPMGHFPARKLEDRVPNSADTSLPLVEATDWLLKKAAGDSGETRRRAIERLVCVYRARLMSAAQQDALGSVLWEQTEANALPDRPLSSAFDLLHLPAPSNVDVQSVLKRHILSLTSTGVFRQEATRSVQALFANSEHPLIWEASMGSKPVVQLSGEPPGMLDWTVVEANELLLKVMDWWNNDKVALKSSPANPFFNAPADWITSTTKRLGLFLSRVVLPRMGQASEEDWIRVLAFMSDVRSNGGFPTLALPYLLLYRPGEFGSVAATVLTDLTSVEEARVCAAADAVRHWFHLSANARVMSPPEIILTSLIDRVILRWKPGLWCCLDSLTRLITDVREAFDLSEVRLLVASLRPWKDATAPKPTERNQSVEFSELERPTLRIRIARLAAALSLWYDLFQPALQKPQAIVEWQQLCDSYPLPELRRAFEDWRRQ